MDHEHQHNYFDLAYRTGSDVWTHLPYQKTAFRMMPQLPPDTIVLDIGSGRGVWAFALVDHGYRVIGIDYVRSIVDKVNQDIKNYANAEKVRFMHADATELPFTDDSFQLATEIGMMQHFSETQRQTYCTELARVVASGGYVLSITLSDQTPRFLGFTPKFSNQSPYEKFGVSYTFFSNDQVGQLFADHGFQVVAQEIEFYDTRTDPGESLGLLFTLAQKK